MTHVPEHIRSLQTSRFVGKASLEPWGVRQVDAHECGEEMRATSVAMPGQRATASVPGVRVPRQGDVLRAIRSPLAAATVMFIAIFSLRMSLHASELAGICLLFTAPIIVLTIPHGTRAGIAGASVAISLVALRVRLQPGHVDALFYVTRAFVFYTVPVAIGLAQRDAIARSAVRSRPAPSRREPRKAPDCGSHDLTPRELEVLGLVAAGHSNADIAEMLVLSIRTVESHRASLLRKLGRPTRDELVFHARLRGLLADDGSALPQLA